MKLSVVLATFNEEKNLSACLDSVKDWCDEIIVVDGSSADNTVAVAKKYGAHIHITSNPPNFHINKQKAIDLAKGDWILQLDADEYVTPELRSEIEKSIQKKEINGYWIPRKNFFLGRFLMKGGVYPDYTMRLYRKSKGKLPQKDVHEQAVVEGRTDHLKNPLIHMADTTFSRYLLRFNRYTDLIANDLIDSSSRLSLFNFFSFMFIKPIHWFVLTFIFHKGFLDWWQGFLFSLMSSLRFPVAYIKFLRKRYAHSSS